MRRLSRLILLLLGALPLAALAAPPGRTFVASNGLDTNPCSLAGPCRGFAAAVAAVADHGEVIVLDSAGYGPVTIAKSVSIIAPPGIYAGVTHGGVIINSAGIDVVLRGLTINSLGSDDGIFFAQGTSLHVENCVISGMGAGFGIEIPAAGSVTHVLDTIVREKQQGILFSNNAVGRISHTRVERNWVKGIYVLDNAVVSIEDSVVTGSDSGVEIYATMLGVTPYVTVARTLVEGGGVGINASAVFSVAHVTVMDSTISNAGVAGIRAQQHGSGVPIVTVARSQLQGNATALLADGPDARLILDGNAVTGNGTGINTLNGATIVTRGNNTVTANGTDTVGTPYTSLGGI